MPVSQMPPMLIRNFKARLLVRCRCFLEPCHDGLKKPQVVKMHVHRHHQGHFRFRAFSGANPQRMRVQPFAHSLAAKPQQRFISKGALSPQFALSSSSDAGRSSRSTSSACDIYIQRLLCDRMGMGHRSRDPNCAQEPHISQAHA